MRHLTKEVTILAVVVLLTGQAAFGDDDPLLSAARHGDVARLDSLLRGSVDVNASRADGVTALLWAVYRDSPEAVAKLLQAGADVNVATDYGVTPLLLACENGNTAVVGQLLSAGADPNRANLTGVTPLMACASAGMVGGVKELLARGGEVNSSENVRGQTALMWALAERHPEVVQVLVANGADVQARSKLIPEPEPYVLDLPDHVAEFSSNYPPTVRFPKVSGGFSAIHFAAQQGDVATARILLEAGADLNARHEEHGSALVIAIASGHEEMAQFLLEAGADPNIKDAWGIAPLHYALHEGLLILSGFKHVVTNHLGWRRHNMPELVESLLDYGADPNTRIEHAYAPYDNPFVARVAPGLPPMIDPVGATPLLLAAASGSVECMNILEEASDVRATTIGGATLFMLAAGAGSERGVRSEDEALEAAKLALELGGGRVNDHLTERALGGPAKGEEDGRTALHFATTLGWTKMIRFLAEQGADLNAKDRYGMTPLQIAMGDPEGRYFDNIAEGSEDLRYRKAPAEGKGIKEVAGTLLSVGAAPYTGEAKDRSGL